MIVLKWDLNARSCYMRIVKNEYISIIFGHIFNNICDNKDRREKPQCIKFLS